MPAKRKVLSGRLWKQRLGWLLPDVVFAPLPVLVVIGAVELAAIIFGQGSFAVSQAGEDGSFYVAIAHNMATGKGITFDGVRKIAGCTVPGRGGQMASSQILRHDRTVTKNEV